jgi:hypothetical protein
MFQPDVPRYSPTIVARLSVLHPRVVRIFAFVCSLVVLSTMGDVRGRGPPNRSQLMTCSPIGGPLPAQLFYVYILKLEISENAGELNEIARTL